MYILGSIQQRNNEVEERGCVGKNRWKSGLGTSHAVRDNANRVESVAYGVHQRSTAVTLKIMRLKESQKNEKSFNMMFDGEARRLILVQRTT